MRIRLLCVVAWLLASGAALAAEEFKVVVNAARGATTLTRERVSRLFLKQDVAWGDGSLVLPVDQTDRVPVRAAFSKAIHGRDVSAIKSYWQRQIFSGTAVPPPEKASDREVLDFVRANPGAIGYVAADTPPGSGVVALSVSDFPRHPFSQRSLCLPGSAW